MSARVSSNNQNNDTISSFMENFDSQFSLYHLAIPSGLIFFDFAALLLETDSHRFDSCNVNGQYQSQQF